MIQLKDAVADGRNTAEGIKASGTTPIEYTDTVWDDLRVPAQNTIINPSKSEPAFEAWLDGLFAYHFGTANADDERLHFSAQLPHTYKEGTDLYPHVHWSPTSTATGYVVWSLEYSVISVNGTFPSSTTIEVTDAVDETDDKHQLTAFDTINGTGLTISAMLIGRLTRRGTATGDTYGADVVLHEFDLHYEIDTAGSKAELTK